METYLKFGAGLVYMFVGIPMSLFILSCILETALR